MTREDEIKCDLITEVLTIIHSHTIQDIDFPKQFIPPSQYDQMISEIEELR